MGIHIPEAARLLLPQDIKFQFYHDHLIEILSMMLLFSMLITHIIIEMRKVSYFWELTVIQIIKAPVETQAQVPVLYAYAYTSTIL
jgi:hypothetical protein